MDATLLELVMLLDTKNNSKSKEVWIEIKRKQFNFQNYFLYAYPKFKTFEGRRNLVFHCISYARINEDAFTLGILALKDKSSIVKYRAACLLAYSLKREAIAHLQQNLNHKDLKTVDDAERAIKAIELQNHNWFMFMGSENSKWIVSPEYDDCDQKLPEEKTPIWSLKNIFKK